MNLTITFLKKGISNDESHDYTRVLTKSIWGIPRKDWPE